MGNSQSSPEWEPESDKGIMAEKEEDLLVLFNCLCDQSPPKSELGPREDNSPLQSQPMMLTKRVIPHIDSNQNIKMKHRESISGILAHKPREFRAQLAVEAIHIY